MCLRGGLPGSFLARGERESMAWREDLIRTFLERDNRARFPQSGGPAAQPPSPAR